ncbi:hypothetical protein HDV00_010236 [Rhizophlyctis rosea]|nr:hypothetical protein HDV00_010236 [Rhizophlyctis rosea]
MPPIRHLIFDEKLESTVIAVTQQLLDAIANGDWDTYVKLCSPELTAFEPEAGEHLVSGLAFHKTYFDLHHAKAAAAKSLGSPTQTQSPKSTTTIASPKVRFLDSDRTIALITYVRIIQNTLASGEKNHLIVDVKNTQETRLWISNTDR